MKMRRTKLIASTLLLFSMALPVQYTSAAGKAASAKTVKVQVTLVSAELVENNHVGNEWYTEATVNGTAIEEDSPMTLDVKTTGSIELQATAEEQDKIPESDTASVSVKVADLSKPVTKAVKLTVTENRGRYSGNTAEWKFTFKVQKK
ncbi:hypothetical protein [Paenibacillus tengchongensis]|uniref:hypothetical protein n=1 Tax=Paenibacillus tengchongensis TaxID=2608684 RepID=UPI00124CB176|nr:hypothetical protein [Paenibacillus tengchongensis]